MFFTPAPRLEERLAGVAHALAPYGFVVDARRAGQLRAYEPFTYFAAPEGYAAGVFGTIEGATVEAYEYDYTSTDSEQQVSHYSALAIAVHHPWVRGGASFGPEHKEWTTTGALLDALLWIPPFTILKVFQYAMENTNPDRTVGDADFDRLYRVRADSDEAAQRAIPPALRSLCVRMAFHGSIELHPGVLLYQPQAVSRLDPATVIPTLGMAAAFLGALAPAPGGHPMR